MNANDDAIELPEEELIAPPDDPDAEANDEGAAQPIAETSDERDAADIER